MEKWGGTWTEWVPLIEARISNAESLNERSGSEVIFTIDFTRPPAISSSYFSKIQSILDNVKPKISDVKEQSRRIFANYIWKATEPEMQPTEIHSIENNSRE